MRVLLTGATGFLGRHTVNRLLKDNVEVIALGRNKKALERLKEVGCRVFQVDLSSPSLLEQLRSVSFDKIVHAAALSGPWGAYEDFYNANVVATEMLLELAKDRKASVVYVSTPSVYLGNGITSNIPETAPMSSKPINHYCSTKILAEQRVVSWQKETGLSVIVLRPQGLLGAYDPSFAPRICAQLEKGFFPLVNGGEAHVDMTHVENVAEAIFLALRSDKNELGIYNITNGEPRPVRQTIELFAERLKGKVNYVSIPASVLFVAAKGLEFLARMTGGWEPPMTVYGLTVMGLERTLCIDAAKMDLGYKPLKTVEQAVDEYFHSIR